MKQSPKLSLFQALVYSGAIATSATLSLLAPAFSRSVNAALQDSPKAVLDEAWQIVNRDYVDGSFNQVNWQEVRKELLSKGYTSREQAYTALRKALEKLNDPYTRFLDPEQYEALTSQTAGEMSGVGMQLEEHAETKIITVVQPMENSPASAAGIQAGDQILGIDGKPTQGMTVSEAAQKIRGEVGTKVTLKINRPGEQEFDVTLTRARIEVSAVTSSVKQEGNQKVGYIRLVEFSSHAGEQMERAIKNLNKENVDAFVLDLRANPGGLLRISIDIARMWMNSGEIVKTVDRIGGSEDLKANFTALTDKPLMVLVDDDSASASEILAGALKDNKRAVIVGDNTFGKALVQSVHGLSDGSGLAVTIAHYYTPSGTDISKKGVAPDVKIVLTDEEKVNLAKQPKLIATDADPVYSKAISILQTELKTKPVANNQSNSLALPKPR